jgi:hypothetical protein
MVVLKFEEKELSKPGEFRPVFPVVDEGSIVSEHRRKNREEKQNDDEDQRHHGLTIAP